MKGKILSLLIAMLMACSVGGLSACKQTPPPASPVKKIDATLLDGKIANFLGAEGLGVLDKSQQATPTKVVTTGAKVKLMSAVTYAQNDGEITTQKQSELVKDTKSGHKDIHFYNESETVKNYLDLNKQFETHHHDGAQCTVTDCDQISDEIANQEESAQANTIMKLDARINKLYNYKDFTFFSVTSAIEGEVTIRNERRHGVMYLPVNNDIVLINGGNGAELDKYGVSYFTHDGSVIFVKQFENDTNFHTSNYWSDDYNQSYVTDNKTGKTYSLSEFPRIFSVENGIIKVHNENANGKFDYFEPTVVDGAMTFKPITMPTPEEFNIPFNSYINVLKKDIYGNKVIENRNVINNAVDTSFDANGEKKIGDNMIVSARLQSVISELQNSPVRNLNFAYRYQNFTKYHLGNDGRIYRLNFKGNLSDISVSVLDENCAWQAVDNNTTVKFEGEEWMILWSYSFDSMVRDYFRISKIENGYAYYSSAATTDGGAIWDSHISSFNYLQYGEYSGVVKIPVNGPTLTENSRVPYEHLAFFAVKIQNGMDYAKRFNTFLIGETQMLTLFGSEHNKGQIILTDVTTGESKELGGLTRLIDMDTYSICLENYGWLSLVEEIDFTNFDQTKVFTQEPIDYTGGLDAYFKFLTENN